MTPALSSKKLILRNEDNILKRSKYRTYLLAIYFFV